MYTKKIRDAFLMGVSAASLCILSGQAFAAETYDFVTLIDDSGSNGTYGAEAGDFMTSMDNMLEANGVSGNRFGLTAFGGTYSETGAVLDVGGSLFGSSSDYASAVGSLTFQGSREDGYAAIVLMGNTYSSAFRSDAGRSAIMLTSDETRTEVDYSIDQDDALAALTNNNIRFTAIAPQTMRYNGNEAIAVVRPEGGSDYLVYYLDSGVLKSAFISSSAELFDGVTVGDYTALALGTDGAIVDYSNIGVLGGTSEDSLLARLLLAMSIEESADDAAQNIEDSGQMQTQVAVRNLVSSVSGRTDALRSLTRSGGQQSASLRGDDQSGLAGGDQASDYVTDRLAVWAEATGTLYSDWGSSDPFEGFLFAGTGGADYRVTDSLLLGASIGFESAKNTFQSGRDRDTVYFNTTLYGAYLLTDSVAVDGLVSVGYGRNEVNQALALVGDGKSQFNSVRVVSAANLSYQDMFDQVTLYGAAGLSYAHESMDDYRNDNEVLVETDSNRLAQTRISGDVGYQFDMGDGVLLEPFVTASLEWDILRSDDNDRVGMTGGGGVRTYIGPQVSAGLYGYTELVRSEENAYNIGANLRYQF